MNSLLQITFRNLERSSALEEAIRLEADRLERAHGPLWKCHVTVELPHRHQHSGNLFEVRLHIVAPSGVVVSGHDSNQNEGHENAYAAVRDAFDRATRQLDNRAGRTHRVRAAQSA